MHETVATIENEALFFRNKSDRKEIGKDRGLKQSHRVQRGERDGEMGKNMHDGIYASANFI